MTHVVLRGEPTKAQLYLENVIRELVKETGKEEDRYRLNKILFKCLRDHPDDIRHINAATGERETNRSLLERSIRVARALEHAGVKPGDTVLLMSKNNLDSMALYFGSIFAGVDVFLLFYELTYIELTHFLGLKMPKVIFAEPDSCEVIDHTLNHNGWNSEVIFFGRTEAKHQLFSQFIDGFDGSVENYWPVDVHRDSIVLTIPTSGSTGLPKAAEMNSKGLVAQLSGLWSYKEVPSLTEVYFCPSNFSWLTSSIAIQVCATFRVTALFTTASLTFEHSRHIFTEYKPTTIVVGGHYFKALLADPKLQPEEFHCFQSIYLIGAPVPVEVIVQIKKRCRPGTLVNFAFGMTEAQGFVTSPSPVSPLGCNGKIVNTLLYKVVDEEGRTLGANEPGELMLKSEEVMFKSYANNIDAYKSSFDKEGWLKTGDCVKIDENGEMFYVERIKFLIKFQNHQISPNELETVLSSVEGVFSAAALETDDGPGALVVPLEGHTLDAQTIHDIVKKELSDQKRLRGGIAFVKSLPLTVNHKLDRKQVRKHFEMIDSRDIRYDSTLKN